MVTAQTVQTPEAGSGWQEWVSPPPPNRRLKYLMRAVREGALSGDGRYSGQCERWIEENCQTRRAMLTPSCTSALELSALLLNIGPGDEIIMPSYTFCSTANAFVLRGAVPVLVDVLRDDLTIDPAAIRANITERTRAIVPVHYAGNACAMDAVLEIASEHQLFVIEDAAQAMMSKYRSRPLGSLGQIGCVSFHATKDISSGHGGAILINEPALIGRAEIIRDRGTNRASFRKGEIDRYSWVDIGSSFFISELCSAYLLWQFEAASLIAAQRRRICRAYRAGLTGLHGGGAIQLPTPGLGSEGNGHFFYFFASDAGARGKLLDWLTARGIAASFHYTPLHQSDAGRRYCRVGGSLDVTEEMSARIVRLPVQTEMTFGAVERIVDAVHEFFQ
ncbi:MAG: dTDP-4-amino-4,6-dideoxygalactose transaminase [Rhodospirillaceae bacterium]